MYDEEILERPCSVADLHGVLKSKYGKDGRELQRDRKFNIWNAYVFLKRYTGIAAYQFGQNEYSKRMRNIQEVLNI